MDAKLFETALILLTRAPDLIGFINTTYQLFKGGKLTADELQDMWAKTGDAVKAAEAKWKAAGQ